MAEALKIAGLKLKIDGAAEFQRSLTSINSTLKTSNTELSKVQAIYGKTGTSVEALTARKDALAKKLETVREKSATLKNVLAETEEKYGGNSKEAERLRAEIGELEVQELKLKNQVDGLTSQINIQSSAWTQLGTKLESASAKITAVGQKMTSIGKTMSMAITAPLAAAGTAAFKFAADLQDAMGASDQIFKDASDDIKSWADDLESYYGIAESQALSYANTMGAMLQNIGGLSEEEAAKQSTMLVELAGDLTAMFGGTTESAVQALTGALKGNNSMLDNYGMGVNEATIKTKALEMGLIAEGEQLDLASKQAATLALIMEQTADAQGQAAREAGGASGAWRAFQTEIKNLATDIGEVLLPIITPLITKLKEITQCFSELPEATKKNIVMFAGVAAAIGPALVIFGKITTGIGSLVGVLGKASLAIGKAGGMATVLKGALAAITGPVAIVVAAIAGLGAAFANLWKNNEEFRNKMTEIWDGVKANFSEFGQGITERLNELGFDFENFGEVVSSIWNGFCELLAPVFETVWAQISTILGAALDVITGLFDVFAGIFTGDWDRVWQGIEEIFGGIWNAIKGTLENVLGLLKGLADTFLGWFGTSWDEVWTSVSTFFTNTWNSIKSFFTNTVNGIKTTATNVWNAITSFFTNTLNGIKTTFTNIWNGISTSLSNTWNTITSTVKNKFNEVKSSISNICTTIKDTFSGLISSALNWGRNLIQGFIDGIKSKIQAVKDAVSSVTSAVGDFLGFNSPAKKGEGRFVVDWGENMIDAFLDGVSNMQDAVAAVVGGVTGQAAAATAGAGTQDNRSYSYGGITVQSLVVREEADIKRIAKELYSLQTRTSRGMGVKTV